jgi:type I restriction enzyme R subunit
MTFNEANTVEAFVRDLLCGRVTATALPAPGFSRKGNKLNGVGWHFYPPNISPASRKMSSLNPSSAMPSSA